MKKFQLYGVGNAILDMLGRVSDETFDKLVLTKSSMNLVSEDVQKKILHELGDIEMTLASGGSAANTIITFQALGGKSSFSCMLGTDSYGDLYKKEFNELGVSIDATRLNDKMTGTSLILITPDAERTMNTCLGAAAELTALQINEEYIANSEWVYIEGYLLSQPNKGFSAALKMAEMASRVGTKVALTFSDSFLVSGFRKELDQILKYTDLIFANEDEGATFTGLKNDHDIFNNLKKLISGVVLTRREKGALVAFNGKDYEVPAFPCEPVDMTGAGDTFAGAFLYGILSGCTPAQAGRGACYLAMKTITQIGARPKIDYAKSWNEAQI